MTMLEKKSWEEFRAAGLIWWPAGSNRPSDLYGAPKKPPAPPRPPARHTVAARDAQ